MITPAARRAAPRAARPGPRGLPHGARAARASRRSTPRRSTCDPAVQRPAGPDRAVRHHRRRARLPGRAGDAAGRARLRRSPATTPGGRSTRPPDGRRPIFVGDLVDRGPDTPGVLRLVMGMVAAGHALCVPGNHEHKLLRALRGRNVRSATAWPRRWRSSAAEPAEFRGRRARRSSTALISHYVLDGGRLVVAHAGLIERYQAGPPAGSARSACTARPPARPTSTGCRCATRGRRTTAVGRWWSTATPRRPTPEWVNNTICLDTGCVFGGR